MTRSLAPNKILHKTSCRFVLVTGPSGAGRSTAINVLEDLGFEAIDNLPLRLLPTLLGSPAADRPMALGVDTRNRDFSTAAVLEAIDGLTVRDKVKAEGPVVGTQPDAPDRNLEVQDTKRMVAASLSLMNDRYANALRLRLIEERDREECAQIMGVTVGNFDVILHRASKAFRKVFPP